MKELNHAVKDERWKSGLTMGPIMGTIVLSVGTLQKAESSFIGDSLFGATRQAVLRLFFSRPEQRYYQRQIIRLIGLGSGAVQRDLERLTRAGIFSRTVEGRQTYYQANSKCPVFDELRGLIRKTFGIADVLRDSLTTIAPPIQLAFVYGSVARGSETAASDIDLMIVGNDISLDLAVSALGDVQAELGREINPTVYTTGDFCRKLAQGQHFLKTVVKGPKLFIIGDENELEELAEERVAKRAQNKPRGDRGPVRRRR